MFRPDNDFPDVYLCLDPQDFRKGILGLSLVVESVLSMNPMSGQLFVFRNKGRSKVKILGWERNGFCLWQKQLEVDKFHWPKQGAMSATLTGQQLNPGFNKGLNRFSLRGKKKVDGQWKLFCGVQNVEKLAKYSTIRT